MARLRATRILEWLVAAISLVWISGDAVGAQDAGHPPPAKTEPDTTDPAKILRAVAAGADALEIATVAFRNEKSRTLLKIEGTAEIADLLGLIDTPPIDTGSYRHHMCIGHPKMSFSKAGKVVAEISFDHVSMLRPYSKGLWGGGDVDLTDASARAMAKWFEGHGFELYQDEIDAKDRERDRWNAFHAAFPPRSREALTAKQSRGIDWVTSGGKPEDSDAIDCASLALAPLSSEIPSPIQQARVIFRALGNLNGSWNSYTEEVARVLRWAACIRASDLAQAVEAASSDKLEQRGAARVLFGAPTWIFHRLERPIAERITLSLAPALLLESEDNTRGLPMLLARFESKLASGVLAQMAAKTAEVDDSPCQEMSWASVALSALVVLAERGTADPEVVTKAAAHAWRCRANRSAALIAGALAANRLPKAQDLRDADRTAALTTLARLKREPTPAAERLARDALMPHPWGAVREEAEQWLAERARARSKEPRRAK